LLTALATATHPKQTGQLPGARVHPLKGERKGQWALSVTGNWRLVFEFDGEDATNVDVVDYH
jgi:proteic killer suppression protein